MAATPRMPGRVNDRRLYILAAILIPLIVLAGFARTYYLKPFFATPDLPGRIVHLHGIIMTWLCLKIGNRTWPRSVPSAVADGYASRGARLVNVFSILIVDPSAIADGTDRVQANLRVLRQSFMTSWVILFILQRRRPRRAALQYKL